MKHVWVGLIAGGLALGALIIFAIAYQIGGWPGAWSIGLVIGVTIAVAFIDWVTEKKEKP